MTKIKPQTLKGFRDFLPEEAKKRQFVINTLREVFESYGFEPLETPALEYTETLLGKYGSEADKLIYQFEDLGGRKVGLRYDLTVPLARVIASYPTLPMPFKRYQIQSVWRADKPQAGRYREFVQCDIDTIGVTSLLAEAEIISSIFDCMERLGFNNYLLLINDRKIFAEKGITDRQQIRELDKLPIDQNQLPGEEIVKIFQLGNVRSYEDAKSFVEEFMKTKQPQSVTEIKERVASFKRDPSKIRFIPVLARGLNYYTGIIFELQVTGYKNLSVGGGGRYDKLVGQFTGKDFPATGFSFGIDRLIEAMEQQGLFKNLPKTTTKVLVTIFSPEYLEKSVEIADKLREAGISIELYLDPEANLDKQLKYANQKGIPYVVILGPDEVKKNEVTLKNMETGDQEKIPQSKLSDYFK